MYQMKLTLPLHSLCLLFLFFFLAFFSFNLTCRVINRAPGLKLVVQTLLSSLRPIGNIVLICCTFFIIFGILGVQVGPCNASLLSFFSFLFLSSSLHLLTSSSLSPHFTFSLSFLFLSLSLTFILCLELRLLSLTQTLHNRYTISSVTVKKVTIYSASLSTLPLFLLLILRPTS